MESEEESQGDESDYDVDSDAESVCSTTSHTSQAAQEPSFKVFINKFPLHVTRDNIKEHLKVCGLSKNVKRVCIFHDREKKKSKGCGYIEFTPVKIGRMAISKLNSTLLLGKHEIHAKKFSERKKQKSNNNNNKRPSPHPLQGAASSTALSLGGDEESHMNSEPGMSKVFVGAMGAKLPKSINNFHLRRHFKEFDSGIIRADIVKDPETRESKGYGFVTFKSKSVAQKAIKKLNHSLLHECTLKLQFATTSKAPQGRQQKPDTSSISMASTNRIQQTIQHEQAHFHTASPSDNPLAATSIPPLATGTSSPGPRSPLMPLPAATNIPSLATGMSSPGLQSPLVPLPAATNISPLTTAMSSPGLQSPFPPATSIPPLATGMSSPGLQSPLVPFPAATNISPLTTATKNPSLLSPHLPVSNTVAVHNLNPAISKDEISVLCTGTIVCFDRNEVDSSATIAFSSHHDAEMAIEKLNGKTLLGQTLSANLIQPAAVPVLNQPISPLSPVNIAHTNIVQTTGVQSTTESSATESIKLNPEQWNLLTAMNSAGSNLYQELSKPFVANPDVKIDLLIDKVTVVFTGKPAAVQSAWDYFRNGILRQIPIDLDIMKALMAIFSTLPKTIAEKYCVTLSGFQAGSRLLKCDGDNVHGANLEIQGLIQHFQKTPVTPQIPLTADLLTSVSKRLSVDNIAASVCTPEESVTALNGAVSVLVCSFSPEDNEKAVKIVRGKPSVKYVPFSPSQSVKEAQFQNIATRFSVVAYIQENEQRVCIKGYVKKDVQAAFGEIKSLMDRQSTICKPIVCSPEQMLYLENRVQHADESTKHVLSSLPAKVIGGNPLCLQGSPEEVERAQKEMMEGPLFQNLKYRSFQFKAHNKFFSQIEQYVLRPLKKECQDLLYIMNDHEKNENREQRAKQGRKGSLKPEVTGFTITIFSQDSATFDCAVAALKDVKVCIKNLQVKHTKAMQHVKEEAKDIERQHKAQIIVHKQSSVIRIFCLSEQEARQCLSELNELISSTVIKKFIPLRRYETNYLKIKKTDEFQVLKRDCQSFKLLDHQKDKDTVLIQVEATIQKVEAVEQELTELIGENFFVKTVYVQCPEKFRRLWEKRWRDLRKVKQQHYDLVIDFKADETEASDSSKQVAYIFTIYGCDSEGGREVESIIRDVDNGQQTVEKTISLPPEAIMTLFKDRKDKKFYMTDQVTVSMYIDTRRNRVLLTSPQTCKDDLEAAEEEIRKYLGDLTRMQKEIPISNPIIGMILGSKEKSFSHLTYANQLAKPHGVTVQCLRPPRCGLVLRGSEESILQVECLIREQVISAIQATLDEVKIIVKPALIPYFSSSDFTHFSARLKDDLCVLAVVKGPNEVIRSVLVQTSSTANYIKLDICKGNLVNETVDAIVNTANESLKHAGGVARALLEAGGETIQRESDEYIHAHGELKPGSVVCLGAGNLSCKQLVHAVGPRWAGGNSGEEQTLYFTVMKILTTVQSEGLESVALPAIGTGIFGVPEDVCIQASLKALRDFCQVNPNSRIHHVRFVLLQKKLADKFAKAIDSLGCTIEEQSSQFSVTKSTSSDYNTWLWKNDGGSYIPYSDDLNTKFNDEYRKNPQGIVSFTNNGTIYSIDFSTMIQTNMMTHFKRNVKRSPATNNPAVVQWHYQNDHGIPTPYSPQDSQAIESMYQAKDPGILMISKKQYTFDFNQMCQINLLTSYRRPIDRVESRSPTKEPSHTFSRSFKEEHVVTLHGPQANLPLAKSKMEVKLKSALKKSKIMVPIAMESRIEQIASKYDLSFEITTNSQADKKGGKKSQKVLILEGVAHEVQKATSVIQEEIISYHTSAAEESVEVKVPDEWQPQTKNLELCPVLPGSVEWNKIECQFKATLPNHIQQINRIQNKWLWEKYAQHKQRLTFKNNGRVNEMELFHGTRGNDPKLIYQGEDGFDMRFSAQGMWGRANYFAVNANYSHNYAYSNRSGFKEMFLVKVLTGDSHHCSSNSALRLPPEKQGASSTLECTVSRYDTVNGFTHGSQVYMTYDNDKAYPAYLIEYC